MDSAIQGMLAILGTVTGPSAVLDGLVDQIVSTGFPAVPLLMAAAVANPTPVGTPSADATARMLLNGVQRASEFVNTARKIAIVKGICAHVCLSGVLPWAVRAFAVKTLQSMVQNHFVAGKSADEKEKSEVVSIAADTMITIMQTAHLLELAKHLKVMTEAVDAFAAVPHPYHSAEIKSAADFFALLTEMDADAVATAYAPKQKQQISAVAELVRKATEDPVNMNAAAAASVAQAIQPRYDPVALGGTRTAPLRIALEKLNCGALNDMTKELQSMPAAEAFDCVIRSFPYFFGRAQMVAKVGGAAATKASSGVPAAEGEEEAADNINADGQAAGEAPVGVQAEEDKTAAFASKVNGLVLDQTISRETVGIFIKSQLKDAVVRAADELSASVAEAPSSSSSAIASSAALRKWEGRVRNLLRNGLLAKANAPLAESLIAFIAAVIRLVALNPHATEAVELIRNVEKYIHRSFSTFGNHHANNNNHHHHHGNNASGNNGGGASFPPASAAEMTPAHVAIADALAVLLKTMLPTPSLIAQVKAELAQITLDGTNNNSNATTIQSLKETAIAKVLPNSTNFNLTSFEAALLFYMNTVPRPRRVIVSSSSANANSTTNATTAVGEKRPREEEEGENEGEGEDNNTNNETGEENNANNNHNTDDNTADDANATSTAKTPATAASGNAPQYEYYNDDHAYIANASRGMFYGHFIALQQIISAEIQTIQIATKLRSLIKEKARLDAVISGGNTSSSADNTSTDNAAAEEDAPSAASNAFLSLPQLQYRQTVLVNIVNALRVIQGASRISIGAPSYVPVSYQNNNSNANGAGNNSNNNNNNNGVSAAGNNNSNMRGNAGNHNNNSKVGGGDFKRFRNEEGNNGRNNNNNTFRDNRNNSNGGGNNRGNNNTNNTNNTNNNGGRNNHNERRGGDNRNRHNNNNRR